MEASDPSDHALMMEAIKAYRELHGVLPPLQAAMQAGRTLPPPEAQKRLVGRSRPFSEVVALYLEEKKLDNNANTRKAKERTYADFQALFSDVDINLLGKPELVQWNRWKIQNDRKIRMEANRAKRQKKPEAKSQA